MNVQVFPGRRRCVCCTVGCVAAVATGLEQVGGNLVKISHVRGLECCLQPARDPLAFAEGVFPLWGDGP